MDIEESDDSNHAVYLDLSYLDHTSIEDVIGLYAEGDSNVKYPVIFRDEKKILIRHVST